MVVHVLNAEMYHLTPGIILGLINNFKNRRFAFILLGNNIDKSKYSSGVDEHIFNSFVFCSYNPIEIAQVLSRYKSSPILFHGGTPKWWQAALDAGCTNVNWICWGGDAKWDTSRRAKQNCIKRLIGGLYDKWAYRGRVQLYSRFNTIVCLMSPDKASIINQFKVKEEKVHVISYWSDRLTTYKNLIDDLTRNIQTIKADKPLVLLGNNPGNIPYYFTLLDILKRFAGRIQVHCMLQYSLIKDERYNELVEKGKSFFGEDFVTDEEFMNMQQYYPYMNTADVFICAHPDQSGLGAINTMVMLGKKVYITGKNLEFVTGYGAVVNDVAELNSVTYEDFVTAVPGDIQIHNRKAQERCICKSIPEWEGYLKLIDSDYCLN